MKHGEDHIDLPNDPIVNQYYQKSTNPCLPVHPCGVVKREVARSAGGSEICSKIDNYISAAVALEASLSRLTATAPSRGSQYSRLDEFEKESAECS